MSNKQLVLCLETSDKDKSDWFYINAILEQYYDISKTRISYVYMNGKNNYNNKRILKEIKSYTLQFKTSGSTNVVYLFDKDLNNTRYEDKQFVINVTNYCQNNNYELIWFVKTIEEVMWGKKIHKNDKTKKAMEFVKKNKVLEVNEKKLLFLESVNTKGNSNIMTVLNKFDYIKKTNY